MEIRTINPTDAELLVPVFDAYRQFYEQPSDEERALVYLSERLPARDCFGIVAVSETGTAAGMALVYPTFSSVRMKPIWTLNDFFVVPEHRGSGLAGQIMEALYDLARDKGIGQLNLITHTTNERAQAHYRKMGWNQSEFLRFEREL